jgi:hypothetical protein
MRVRARLPSTNVIDPFYTQIHRRVIHSHLQAVLVVLLVTGRVNEAHTLYADHHHSTTYTMQHAACNRHLQ